MPSESYLEVAREWDNFPSFDRTTRTYQGPDQTSWYQFLLPNDPHPHGFMLPWVVQKMPWTSDFLISHESPRTVQLLDSSNGKNTLEACNSALSNMISLAASQHAFRGFDELSSESFLILGSQPPIRINRTAAAIFGIAIRGVHINVYQRVNGQLKIWVARRSPTSFSYPNMLDSAVGGGIKADQTPLQAAVSEAGEEASLPEIYLRENMRACGVLTYMSQTDERSGYESGLMVPEIAYVYELEIEDEDGMELKPHDGEVEKFTQMEIEEVERALKRGEFKPSSAAVMVDFLVRHGFVTDENERNYLEVVRHNHRELPVVVASDKGLGC